MAARPFIGSIFVCAFCAAVAAPTCMAQEGSGASSGQDVIVTAITGVDNYFSETPPGSSEPIDAFSIGTICCNAGDAPLPAHETDNQHFVLRQGMFRLKGGRFEQIGTSWVRHVYPVSNEPGTCGLVCENPHTDPVATELRPGCTDANSAGLNGDRQHTSLASEVNAFTGDFPSPGFTSVPDTSIDQRIQVHHSDLNPALNPGASYFVEAHYIHPGDAAAGNGDNNATFARVTLFDQGTGTYDMKITSPALNHGQTKPAILAWQDADASVNVNFVRVPGEGLLYIAAKATSIGGGFWHYEYAVENFNSDRAAGSFRVPLPAGALVQNRGFHDFDYDSGEPQVGTDWTSPTLNNSVVWATESFAENPNANAIRWSTLYNFRFDANIGPAPTTAVIGMFKPGTPTEIQVQTIGPALAFMDCNGNGRLDACDVNCSAEGCSAPCGQSLDCNANGLPDECETDCNSNGVPDDCDISQHVSEDCNGNGVPDECDPDCNEDGTPDDCEGVQDADGDGFPDCADQCPLTTPPGGCAPPENVWCLANSLCTNLPRSLCLSIHGTPYCNISGFCEGWSCPNSMCRDGCLPGDYDGDGDRDLRDFSAFAVCFSGASMSTIDLCLGRFDMDANSQIDLSDLAELQLFWQDPF